jgi:hypothetical protein
VTRTHALASLLLVGVAQIAACHGQGSTACNGHQELCGRRYDQVAFPGTHNAYSNRADNFGAPDQTFTIRRQLDDGVRVLHLEIYPFDNDVYLCHSICQIGSQLLLDGLTEVDGFVEAQPREVVTLLMESSHVPTDAVARALQASGLGAHLHAQAAGAPWPTLQDMIDRGERVVALLADMTTTGGGTYPWLLDRWQFTWETPWDNQSLPDFLRCDADRGKMGNDLYVVDTYLEDQIIPTADHAALVNSNPFLIDRLEHCLAATGRTPNFVMVNYYEVGQLFPDVDALNGLDAPPDGGGDARFPTDDAGPTVDAGSTD